MYMTREKVSNSIGTDISRRSLHHWLWRHNTTNLILLYVAPYIYAITIKHILNMMTVCALALIILRANCIILPQFHPVERN